MLYEFIATISAGFALAGVALIIRHLSKLILKKQTPKWLTPLFAAIGIFGFQVHQEYHWFEQIQSQLPEGVEVVKTIEETHWYRPWTYAKPQITRFIAVDIAHLQTDSNNPTVKRGHVYLFARRMSSQVIPQAFDCQEGKRADIPSQDKTASSVLDWIDMDTTDPLYLKVCQ